MLGTAKLPYLRPAENEAADQMAAAVALTTTVDMAVPYTDLRSHIRQEKHGGTWNSIYHGLPASFVRYMRIVCSL